MILFKLKDKIASCFFFVFFARFHVVQRNKVASSTTINNAIQAIKIDKKIVIDHLKPKFMTVIPLLRLCLCVFMQSNFFGCIHAECASKTMCQQRNERRERESNDGQARHSTTHSPIFPSFLRQIIYWLEKTKHNDQIRIECPFFLSSSFHMIFSISFFNITQVPI